MVEVEFQLLFRVDGGWSDKTKLILISTLVEVVVEVEVELGKKVGSWEDLKQIPTVAVT